jgi:phosphoesterase RecJ-like protein
MTAKNDLNDVVAALREGESFILSTHASPDGDAIGSLLGMRSLLTAMGKKQVSCVMQDPVPGAYRWLPGATEIVSVEAHGRPPQTLLHEADAFVIVDAAKRDRIGSAADLIRDDMRLIVIDHHTGAIPEGDVHFVDSEYAAVGEIVAELFGAAEINIDADCAQCLYAAVATDTGSFRYPCTSARSHRITADLLDAGADVAASTLRLFDSMPRERFDLMVRVLDRMEFLYDGRIALSQVDARDLAETGARDEDLNNLINYGRSVDGVQVGILLRSMEEGVTKVSLRSHPPFDCSDVARRFGGGGHPGAAGATLNMSMERARPALLAAAEAMLSPKRKTA